MDLDLMQLRYLVAVSQERNFTRAAERCFVTQQSLSAGIARLERAVAAPLVARTTRRVEMTAAGSALAERAERALAEIDAGVLEARAVDSGARGRIVFGFHGPGADIADPLLARFRARHPDVEVSLRRADFDDPSAGVLSGMADAAVVAAPLEHADLDAVELQEEPMVFVLPATHPLAGRARVGVEELDGEPIALMENPADDPLVAQWNRFWTLAHRDPPPPTAPASFNGVEEWLADQRSSSYISTGPSSAGRLYPATGVSYVHCDELPGCVWRLYYRPAALTPAAALLVETARTMPDESG